VFIVKGYNPNPDPNQKTDVNDGLSPVNKNANATAMELTFAPIVIDTEFKGCVLFV
jgi:hypothetical protein